MEFCNKARLRVKKWKEICMESGVILGCSFLIFTAYIREEALGKFCDLEKVSREIFQWVKVRKVSERTAADAAGALQITELVH